MKAVLKVTLCTWLFLSSQPLASSSCRSPAVGDPFGNYFIPNSLGAISYHEVNGQILQLDAYVQPGPDIRPGIVVVHGGKWTSGSRIAFVSQFLELLTKEGFNWFSVDYRLAPGAKHPAPVEDLGAALDFVRCNADYFRTDPNRLALLAEDSGVPPAFLLGSRTPERVAAMVGLGGYYDLSTLPIFDQEADFEVVFGLAGTEKERRNRLRAASPLDAVRRGQPPSLLIHGLKDSEVPVEQARDYCKAAQEADSRCRLIEIENGIHRPENWLPSQWAYKGELATWLKEVLGPVPPPLWSANRNGKPLKNLVYGEYQDGSGQSRQLLMDAYLPESDEATAVVILAHGGGWEAGNKITYLTPVLEPLAGAGFAWFSIDYRLTPEFRNHDQLEDLRRAVRFVRANASQFNIDPERIGILGESASGQMVTQVGALPCKGKPDADDPVEHYSCEAQAIVSFYGVYDFLSMVKDASPRSLARRLFGFTSLNSKERSVLRDYSPYYKVHEGMPPILLINGTSEKLWEQATSLADRLTELGVSFDLIKIEGAPHGMENWEGRPEWQFYKQEMVEWLKRTLQ